MLKLEICAQTLASAIAAQEGGAHRIELCAGIEIGGITPSYATIRQARKLLTIEICVLIRPRGGDFLYTDLEFETLKQDILFSKEQGIDGVVVGCVNADGSLDMPRMKILAQYAYPMEVVCHRAFDGVPDPFLAIEQLIEARYDRILTCGQAKNAYEGRHILRGLVEQADDRIEIMPGNGVTTENLAEIIDMTKAKTYHMTAKQLVTSTVTSEKDGWRENNYFESDINIIKNALTILKQHSTI
jgi:copper homeostasis protein